jgi:hypothetical protein
MAPVRRDPLVQLDIDPSRRLPEEAADGVAASSTRGADLGGRRRDDRLTPPLAVNDAVAAQLARLTAFSPAYVGGVCGVHYVAVRLGYHATAPSPLCEGPPPSCRSHIDGANSRTVGNLSSEKFNVMRRGLHDELAQYPLVGADTRHAHVAAVNDDTSRHVLTIARDGKESNQ